MMLMMLRRLTIGERMIDKIYIPTFRRVDNQATFDNLPDEYKEKVVMVVQEQEKDEYKYDVEYLVVDNNIGIAKTRELICRDAGNQRFYMIDDDVILHRRNAKYFGGEPNMETAKRICTKEDLDDMFTLFHSWMDNDNIMHIGHKSSGLPPGKSVLENKDIIQATMIDGKELSKFIDDIEWDLCQVGEDSRFMIDCLIRGYKNRVTDEFPKFSEMWGEGGLENIRDADLHKKEHMRLMKKYPEFVYIHNDRMKPWGSHGKKLNYTFVEFRYKLKDAYNSSKNINHEFF